MKLDRLFLAPFPVFGVIHLAPLPGSARARLDFDEVLADAEARGDLLERGGVDALLVENFGDAPFAKKSVRPHVPAFLAVLARTLRQRHGVPVGINCLRNDAMAALGAAEVAGAEFIRVNVLIGATATDQGLIEGCARKLLEYRTLLGSDVAILADIDVKHGTSLFAPPLPELARSAVERGGADAVIVTGSTTGAAPDASVVRTVQEGLGGKAPILIGSGMTSENVAAYVAVADGAIVGTTFESDGQTASAIDPARVAHFMTAVKAARSSRG